MNVPSSGICNGSRARISTAGCSRSRTACGSAGSGTNSQAWGGGAVDPDTLVGADGERAAHARLALGDMRRLVAGLPAEQRSALMLVAVDGLSYGDAAGILGVPSGTVASRLARARLALAEAMEGREIDAAPGTVLARSG